MSSLTSTRSENAPVTEPPGTAETDTAALGRRRWSSAVGITVGSIAYFLTLLDYRLDVFRGATAVRFAEQFFELQANSLRDGRLAVPEGSLSIEGFVVDGRTYSYFGIFPALLRMPVQLITHEYDGRLTLLSMAVAWIVFAIMALRMFWLIRARLGYPETITRFEAAFSAVFLAAVLGGTVITFDAALPWVYHEVYLWSVATVCGSLYWLLRTLAEPTQVTLRWLFVFVLAAALTRTTGGWAVCLTTIAAAVMIARGRIPGLQGRRLWASVLAAGVVPLLAGMVVNWLKFRHPYMFPLQNQVFTTINEHRQAVLAENGGTLATPKYFWTSLVHYFRPDGIRFVDYFPWVTFPVDLPEGIGATLDQSYRTGSVTAFMPLLLLLTIASIPMLFRRLPLPGQRQVRLVWFGAFMVTGGVMAYGYIAYRYTSEFVPVFLVGGAVAVHGIGAWIGRRGPALRRGVLVAAGVLMVYSVTVNMAVGHSAAAYTYKGPRLADYLATQLRISGGGAHWKDRVHQSGGMPIGGIADDLWVRGDCDALYFNTGEHGDPWQLVEERDTALLIRTGPEAGPASYELLQHTDDEDLSVSLTIRSSREAQLIVHDDDGVKRGQLFDLPPHALIRVGARNRSELGAAEVSSTPGGFVAFLSTSQWSDEGDPALSTLVPAVEPDVPGDDVAITTAPTLPLELCQDIATAAGLDASRGGSAG